MKMEKWSIVVLKDQEYLIYFRVEDIEGQIKRGRIEVESKVYKEFLISILNRIKSSKNELAEALNRYLEKVEV